MIEDGQGGLLFVGGRLDNSERLNTIYRLTDGASEWQLLDQRLKTYRDYPVLMVVPERLADCS